MRQPGKSKKYEENLQREEKPSYDTLFILTEAVLIPKSMEPYTIRGMSTSTLPLIG